MNYVSGNQKDYSHSVTCKFHMECCEYRLYLLRTLNILSFLFHTVYCIAEFFIQTLIQQGCFSKCIYQKNIPFDHGLHSLSFFFFNFASHYWWGRGGSGGAMVLGKLPVPGRPTIWMLVGQGPVALAVGAVGSVWDIFTLLYPFSPFSPSLGDGPILTKIVSKGH